MPSAAKTVIHRSSEGTQIYYTAHAATLCTQHLIRSATTDLSTSLLAVLLTIFANLAKRHVSSSMSGLYRVSNRSDVPPFIAV